MYICILRPSQGFWGTGEQGHSFQGNRGTKVVFGNRKHRKKSDFGGTSQFISGEKRTGTTPGGPHFYFCQFSVTFFVSKQYYIAPDEITA